MKLLKMPSGFDGCLLYSAAMVLDKTPEELIDYIGHDGQEEWWGGLGRMQSKRGHHIQEIIDVCHHFGHIVMPIDYYPRSAPFMKPDAWKLLWVEATCESRMRKYLSKYPGILIDNRHAVAWDGDLVHDPNGKRYKIDDFCIKTFFAVIKSF